VRNISLSDLVNYEKERYCAENVVIAVAGNLGSLSVEEVAAEAEKYFGIRKAPRKPFRKSDTAAKSILTCGERKTEQTNLIIGFGGPGQLSEDRYAMKILAAILGGSSSSRMFVEVREKLGLAYAAETDYQAYSDAGSIITLANVAHENVEKAARAIISEYGKIIKDTVTKSELVRVREMIKSSMLIGLEDSENLAEMLMRMELTQGKIMEPDKILERYLAVTEQEILSVAKKYIDFDRMIVSIVGHGVGGEKFKDILSF
jgi:predicted Zn-dependent peptidase